MNNSDKKSIKRLKPIKLYDHMPGILAAYPAALFLLLGFCMLPFDIGWSHTVLGYSEDYSIGPMLFWIGLAIMVLWYIAFQFNLPKSRFWLAFGLMGTFVGIPVVLEFAGIIRPFSTLAGWLGGLHPNVNSTAWFVISFVFFVIWIGNLIWSRTHMRVTIDESGLTINRVGGKGERFDLIGLKTENEPIDYLELFIAGIGSLSLKTRMNKPIFTMRRVFGLYRIPLFPFYRGKLARIEEMLTFQGKVVSVDREERAELMEAADMEDRDGDGDGIGEDFDAGDHHEPSERAETDKDFS